MLLEVENQFCCLFSDNCSSSYVSASFDSRHKLVWPMTEDPNYEEIVDFSCDTKVNTIFNK